MTGLETLTPREVCARLDDAFVHAVSALMTGGLAYRDALADMERRDPTLPPHAVNRLPDGRLVMRDGSISGK